MKGLGIRKIHDIIFNESSVTLFNFSGVERGKSKRSFDKEVASLVVPATIRSQFQSGKAPFASIYQRQIATAKLGSSFKSFYRTPLLVKFAYLKQ